MIEIVGTGLSSQGPAHVLREWEMRPIPERSTMKVEVEVVNLFPNGRMDLRVLPKIMKERGRSGLLRSDDDEVRDAPPVRRRKSHGQKTGPTDITDGPSQTWR